MSADAAWRVACARHQQPARRAACRVGRSRPVGHFWGPLSRCGSREGMVQEDSHPWCNYAAYQKSCRLLPKDYSAVSSAIEVRRSIRIGSVLAYQPTNPPTPRSERHNQNSCCDRLHRKTWPMSANELFPQAHCAKPSKRNQAHKRKPDEYESCFYQCVVVGSPVVGVLLALRDRKPPEEIGFHYSRPHAKDAMF